MLFFYILIAGIGTRVQASRTLTNSFFSGWSAANLVDAAIAYTLGIHVRQAYRFLMRYYEEGDQIFLVGFSRGAYIARVLGGMIERVGLLCPGLEDIIMTAWNIYEGWEIAGQPRVDITNTLADEVCENSFFFKNE